MIRGVIWGKEIVRSMTSLNYSAKVKAIREDAITIKYDSDGGYEIEDKEVKPKFWIVSKLKVEDIPGLAPDASRAERLERIEDFLRTESRATLKVKESAPSFKTLKELQKKLERK